MRKYWIAFGAVVLLIAVGAGAFFVGSRHGGDHAPPKERPAGINLQGRPVIELGLAIEKATQLVPGDVLKVELESDDDRYVYEVKVLAENGRVREIKLDAEDGSLIVIEED
jgi:uncharacterized membrane protein YkoI